MSFLFSNQLGNLHHKLSTVRKVGDADAYQFIIKLITPILYPEKPVKIKKNLKKFKKIAQLCLCYHEVDTLLFHLSYLPVVILKKIDKV